MNRTQTQKVDNTARAPITALPELWTLEQAVEVYGEDKLTTPMLRAWIARRELPATRAGKRLLINPADLAARLAPKLRAVAHTQARRESNAAREERLLASAGVSIAK